MTSDRLFGRPFGRLTCTRCGASPPLFDPPVRLAGRERTVRRSRGDGRWCEPGRTNVAGPTARPGCFGSCDPRTGRQRHAGHAPPQPVPPDVRENIDHRKANHHPKSPQAVPMNYNAQEENHRCPACTFETNLGRSWGELPAPTAVGGFNPSRSDAGTRKKLDFAGAVCVESLSVQFEHSHGRRV
jgi:hypothetical protein